MSPLLPFTGARKRRARLTEALRESEALNQALRDAVPDVSVRLIEQRLATVAIQLHLVQRKLELDASPAKELLAQAQAELAGALAEIRELGGLDPPVPGRTAGGKRLPAGKTVTHQPIQEDGMNGLTTQSLAKLVGIAFLAVGVLGFIPGITTDYGDMTFAGHESGAELLGIFQVSILHNIVHLLFGVAGLALAKTAEGGRTFLVGGGAIYLVLAAYGFLIDKDGGANFVPVDAADDWLHLALGAAMVGLGLLTSRGPRARMA